MGLMYIYAGCRDPIQKITGDAYRRIWGIKPGNNYSGGKQSQTRLDYNRIDAIILAELERSSAMKVAAAAGVDQTTLKKRARELGYEFDRKSQRWTREAA